MRYVYNTSYDDCDYLIIADFMTLTRTLQVHQLEGLDEAMYRVEVYVTPEGRTHIDDDTIFTEIDVEVSKLFDHRGEAIAYAASLM